MSAKLMDMRLREPYLLRSTNLEVVVLPELLELLRPVGLDGVERLLDLLGLGRQPVLAAAAAQAAPVPETGSPVVIQFYSNLDLTEQQGIPARDSQQSLQKM